MPPPHISVGLVTRNRPEFLQRALSSWNRQVPRPYELIVSDDSSDDQAVANLEIARKFGAHYVRGPQRGLYANRNHVARHCTGTHVLSADDDHEHPPGYFAACLEAAKQEPTTVWCMGEIIPGDSTVWGTPGQMNARGSSSAPADHEANWAWSDGATVCPVILFESGLRFYEGFPFGWSYLEFGCRAHWLGWKIKVLPGTGVIHHFHESGRSFESEDMDRASRYFALILHAFFYQRSFSRMANAAAVIGKEFWARPARHAALLREALRHVRRRLDDAAGAPRVKSLHKGV